MLLFGGRCARGLSAHPDTAGKGKEKEREREKEKENEKDKEPN